MDEWIKKAFGDATKNIEEAMEFTKENGDEMNEAFNAIHDDLLDNMGTRLKDGAMERLAAFAVMTEDGADTLVEMCWTFFSAGYIIAKKGMQLITPREDEEG